jgi:hypothetical protein
MSRHRIPLLLVVVVAAVGSGCGGQKSALPPNRAQAPAPGAEGGAVVKAPAQPEAAKPSDRKIIYNGALTVSVEDFSRAEEALGRLVKEQGGYVINSEVTGSPGAPRSGQWKVRVPVERFDAFREAVARLGEVERNTTDSQDVTDEYYDLEARIKNKKVEETRLLQHLEKSTGKLEEILAVEKELSRVRGEVEQMQGRLQMLAKLTAMTTVTVTLHERRTYTSPEAPAFGTSIARTFTGSLDLLAQFGKGIVLLLVAVAPWLVILAIVAVPLWLVLRRHRNRVAPAMALPVEPPAAPPPG